jgi:P-type conjugative transfer protein TrbJ
MMLAKRAIATMTTVAMLAMTTPQPAQAGGVFLGATEITQLLNHAELISQYAQQIQQYQTQLNQYENEIKMAQNIGPQFFTSVSNSLVGLQSVVQGGQALSYAMANLDSQFTSKFATLGYQGGLNGTSFASRYASWANTSMQTIQKTLDAAHLQNSNLSTESALVTKLQTMSQSTSGTLQALQAGNQIAAEEVNQLMELRQLMMADMQSKAAFQASQISQQNEANKAVGFFQSADIYQPY